MISKSNHMIKLGIVDQNELFRESLHYSIESKTEMQVELSISSLEDCKEQLRPGMVNLLILEVGILKQEEELHLKEIIHHFPEVKFLVLSDQLSKNVVLELVKLGISNFFPKSISLTELSEGIEKALTNKNRLELFFDQRLENDFNEKKKLELSSEKNDFFSKREIQILEMVCEEWTNSEIALELDLSVRTIETHRRRMIDKTNSKTMIGVILFAFDFDKSVNKQETIRLIG